MVSVNFDLSKIVEEHTFKFYVKGHANSDVEGKDLVCAGISTLTYGFLNVIDKTYTNKVEKKIIDEKGNVEVTLHFPNEFYIGKELLSMFYGIFQSFYISFKMLEDKYPQYVKCEMEWFKTV